MSPEGQPAGRGHSVPAFTPCCLLSSKIVTVNEKGEIPPRYFAIAPNYSCRVGEKILLKRERNSTKVGEQFICQQNRRVYRDQLGSQELPPLSGATCVPAPACVLRENRVRHLRHGRAGWSSSCRHFATGKGLIQLANPLS